MKLPNDMYCRNQENTITCLICPHNCTLRNGELGKCGNRKAISNRDDQLVPVFRQIKRIEAFNLDPIEKKPLYHFYPGGEVLSLGLTGCNMHCYYCQNHALSQDLLPDCFMTLGSENNIEDQIVNQILSQIEQGKNRSGDNNIVGLSFTYSEPTTWFEFMYAVARSVKAYGYQNTLVSNGMMSAVTADKLISQIDGVNFDVKAFDEQKYKRLGGNFQTIKETVKKFVSAGVHTELTYLVVPDFNVDHQIGEFLEWVSSLDQNIPVHFSRYFPSYRASTAPTSVETLHQCYDQGMQYLNHVYLGNLGDKNYQTTYCWNCGETVIERDMFRVKNKLVRDKCPACKSEIAGVFFANC